MTLTDEAIARARLALFAVSGPAERHAFASVRAGANIPANRVWAQSVLWLADRAAAGEE